MKHKIFSAFSTFCALLLCACAGAPPPPPAVVACAAAAVSDPAPAPDPVLGELLVFQAGLNLLKPAELAQALAAPDARPGGAATATAALRRAMLLLAQRASGDLARAQALLDTVVAPDTPDGPALKALAQSLSAGAAGARRQDEAQEKLALQLRDGQRRNEQLTAKLDALKNIERSLSVRAPALPAPVK